jgi:hypothetical protein
MSKITVGSKKRKKGKLQQSQTQLNKICRFRTKRLRSLVSMFVLDGRILREKNAEKNKAFGNTGPTQIPDVARHTVAETVAGPFVHGNANDSELP